jgi:hypothetical protein
MNERDFEQQLKANAAAWIKAALTRLKDQRGSRQRRGEVEALLRAQPPARLFNGLLLLDRGT